MKIVALYPPDRSIGAELIVSPPVLPMLLSRSLSLSPRLLSPLRVEGDGIVTGVTVTELREDNADMAAAATSLL